MKMIIFALLVLVAVLVLLLLRKYTRLEFVGHARLLLKTWSVKLGGLSARWLAYGRSRFRMLRCTPGRCFRRTLKNILPPNIVALISPALVVLAVLSQYACASQH